MGYVRAHDPYLYRLVRCYRINLLIYVERTRPCGIRVSTPVPKRRDIFG